MEYKLCWCGTLVPVFEDFEKKNKEKEELLFEIFIFLVYFFH